MRPWILRAWYGEAGVFARFISALLLIVGGVFSYFSITACGEPGGGGCGNNGTYSSDYSSGRNIAPPPYDMSVSGSASAASAGAAGWSSAVAPGAQVTRYITYSAETGKEPTSIEWTPPEGSTAVNFIGSQPANPGGPAPYIFDNEPPLTLPLHITYNAPALPAGVSSLLVGEIVAGKRAAYTDDIRQLNYTVSAAAARAANVPPPAPAPALAHAARSADIAAVEVQRWYGIQNSTMSSELCQQLYDWLQSDQTFTAMRLPVSLGGDFSTYELPVLFPPDSNASPNIITARPSVNFMENFVRIGGIPDLPLEVRPDRIAFMENHLPSASGERWVALGVAREPKITCPSTGIDKTGWEFNFLFPVNPAAPIDALPLYYCQDGQDPPPIGSLAMNMLAQQNGGRPLRSTQLEGITCLGPIDHALDPDAAIQVHSPNTRWDLLPGDAVSLHHYIQVSNPASVANILFSINGTAAGFGWKLYEGDDIAPDLGKEVNLTLPYPATGFQQFWVVGTVPTGTSPGSYTVTLRAEKYTDTAVYGQSNDILWIGDWVAPPPSGGTPVERYLPLVKKP